MRPLELEKSRVRGTSQSLSYGEKSETQVTFQETLWKKECITMYGMAVRFKRNTNGKAFSSRY